MAAFEADVCASCGSALGMVKPNGVANTPEEQRKLQESMRRGMPILAGIVGLIVLAWIVSVIASLYKSDVAQPASEQVRVAPPQVPQLQFSTLEEKSTPSGGIARCILVDPSHNNRSDIERLGRQLKEKDSSLVSASTTVYDNIEAYKVAGEAMDNAKSFVDERKKTKARKALEKLHDEHFIAMVIIIPRNNVYEVQYHPKGIGNDTDPKDEIVIGLQ
ncbi:MAG TPA: hypothetical protein VJ505_01325 [Holophagaceae bacterium]|nr:hypothetical protein [Holophagaceae bacterium]